MDPHIDKNLEFTEKLKLFFKEQKFKIILISCTCVLISIIFLVMKIFQERENILISEKFIKANIFLSTQNEDKSKELYEEIIKSKNKFYSILALNTILEKNLETNSNKIFNYFKVIESMSLDKEQYDLIIFKKALYLIKTSKKDEGFKLLNNLIDTNSKLKNLAKTLVPID